MVATFGKDFSQSANHRAWSTIDKQLSLSRFANVRFHLRTSRSTRDNCSGRHDRLKDSVFLISNFKAVKRDSIAMEIAA